MAQFSHSTQPPKQIEVQTPDGRTIEIAEEIAANFPEVYKPAGAKSSGSKTTTKETN